MTSIQQGSISSYYHSSSMGSTKSYTWNRYAVLSGWEFLLLSTMQSVSSELTYLLFQNQKYPNIIMYVLSLILVGMPIKYMLCVLGQFSRKSEIFLKHLSPIGASVGYGLIINSAMHTIPVIVQLADLIMYFLVSVQSSLPWMMCPPNSSATCWSGEECPSECINETRMHSGYRVWADMQLSNGTEYEGPDPDIRRLLTVCICWFIILWILTATKGFVIRTMKYIFLFALGLCLLIVLGIICMGYGGAGLMYLINMNFETMGDTSIWLSSVNLVSLFLNIGVCGNVTLGSRLTSASSSGVYAILAVIFHVIIAIVVNSLYQVTAAIILYKANVHSDKRHYLMKTTWEPLSLTVIPNGLGFVSLSQFWTIAYFIAVISINMSYILINIRIAEISLEDGHAGVFKYRPYILIGASATVIMFAVMFTDKNHMIYSTNGYTQGIVFAQSFQVCILTISVCWIYGVTRLSDDIHFIIGHQPTKYWKICWYAAPIMMILAIVDQIREFDFNIVTFIVFFFMVPPFIILTGIEIFKCIKKRDLLSLFRADKQWGPTDPTDRALRDQFNPRKDTRWQRKLKKCNHNCLLNSNVLRRVVMEEMKYRTRQSHLYSDDASESGITTLSGYSGYSETSISQSLSFGDVKRGHMSR